MLRRFEGVQDETGVQMLVWTLSGLCEGSCVTREKVTGFTFLIYSAFFLRNDAVVKAGKF